VFRPVVAEGFEWVQPVDDNDFDAVYQLDGTPRARQWRPIQVRRLEADDNGRPWLPADSPWLGAHALVFRERGYQLVDGLLGDAGEFLELDPVDGTDRLWLYNVTQVVDALDEEGSGLVRFPSTGRVMKVNRHVFDVDRITGLVAFRVPQLRSLFLSGEAVDAISAAKLSGAAFDLVWQHDASSA
jgi:hypothetical protein